MDTFRCWRTDGLVVRRMIIAVDDTPMHTFISMTVGAVIVAGLLAGCTDDRDWITLQQEAAKLIETGDITGAEALARQSLARAEVALGAEHADVAHVHNTLAMVAYAKQDYARVEAHHQRALVIQVQALGEHDLEIGRTLTYLGDFFLSRNRLSEAAAMHERAHRILVAHLGDQHPDVGRSLNNLARIYTKQNRLREAADHHAQALAILEPVLGSDDPEVTLVIDNLTALYSDIVPQETTRATPSAASP